ncbi:MAG TPA: helix-turn-helix transcriptional regulator [Gaiellaceae bacterium]|jgi:tetratricopeptide (TPR) repeat protein
MARPRRHVDDPSAVGRRIREARESAGISQRQLSFEGCTAAYISRIEAGERVPSLQLLQEFARRLGVGVGYLARGEDAATETGDDLLDADLAARLDDADTAERTYRSVLDGSAASPYRRARALAGLGDLALRRGDHREAIDLLEEALAPQALTPDETAAAGDRLGRAYALNGEHDAALGLYERSLAAARSEPDPLSVLRFSTLLANELVDAGNLDRADELLVEAVGVAELARDPHHRARLWWSQSRAHAARDRSDLALRYGRRALEVLDATESIGFAAVAYQLRAHIENERGSGAAALELLSAGEELALAAGGGFQQAAFRLERARALAATGAREQARELALDVVADLADASPTEAGRAYAVVADVLRQLGDTARARELYELAADTLPEADRYLTAVYASLAELLEAEGRQDDALSVLKKALQTQQQQTSLQR